MKISLRSLLRRPQEHLQARLVGAFLGLALMTVLLVAGGVYWQARTALRVSLEERLTAVTLVKEAELNRWVDAQRDDLRFLASLAQVVDEATALSVPVTSPDGRLAARAGLQALLDSAVVVHHLDLEELFLLSPVGGRVLVSTHQGRLDDYRVSDLYFLRGRVATFVQNVYPSPVTNRPTLTVSSPVRNANGELVGVLAGHLNLDRIDAILSGRTGLGQGVETYLVTRFSDFVSADRFGRVDHRRGVHTKGVQLALQGRSGVGQYLNHSGVPVIGAYRWSGRRELALLVEMSEAQAFAPARSLVVTVTLIGLISAVVLMLGGWAIGRKVSQPILGLTEAATRVAAGDFSAEAPVRTQDEIGVLARSFNTMTARLRTLYDDLQSQVDTTTRTAAALRESKELLQGILDNSQTLVAVTGPDGRFLLVNRQFEEAMGLPAGGADGREPAEIVPPGMREAFLEALEAAARDGVVVQRELSLVADGEAEAARHFFAAAFPVREADGTPRGVGLLATDVTERQRVEEDRRQLEAQVQHTQKLEGLGLLAGGIAHDFNNILAAIMGNADLALAGLGDSPDTRFALEQVVVASRRAATLTHQLLAYAGRTSLGTETIDLNETVREMSQLIEVSASKKIELRYALAPSPCWITADPAQITQVVMNLITNAADAIGDRSGRVTVTTGHVEADAAWLARNYPSARLTEGRFVELVVQDTGCGMAPTVLSRIFDPFFSTKQPGRGLGLAAVQGIVRGHEAGLAVTSRPGDGTAFRLLFQAATAPIEEATAHVEVDGTGSGTLLVADDEPMVRRLVRRVLERAGYDVLEAEDGIQAVAMFRAQRRTIRAVILDMTMPGLSGSEALRAIRALDETVPVLISSGYDQSNTLRGVADVDGVEFLQKPYRAEALLGVLSELLVSR